MSLFDKKDDIFKLMEKFDKSTIMEMELEADDGVRIRLSRNPATVYYPPYSDAGHYVPPMAAASNIVHHYEDATTTPASTVAMSDATVTSSANTSEDSGKVIKAPIIGTFYSAASPEAAPFVKVGDKVAKGDVVCILEAMKVMNEIECEQDCEIVEILASDGDVIQFGQPLFKIK